jgi:hypothetical protein
MTIDEDQLVNSLIKVAEEQEDNSELEEYIERLAKASNASDPHAIAVKVLDKLYGADGGISGNFGKIRSPQKTMNNLATHLAERGLG